LQSAIILWVVNKGGRKIYFKSSFTSLTLIPSPKGEGGRTLFDAAAFVIQHFISKCLLSIWERTTAKGESVDEVEGMKINKEMKCRSFSFVERDGDRGQMNCELKVEVCDTTEVEKNYNSRLQHKK